MNRTISTLLVTANVGSIFEDPSVMLQIWTREFLSTVAKLEPQFIALHCQEVGGKNYERSMQHVKEFINMLTTSDELKLFDKAHIYIDEDYSSAEHFTALGNFYFIHQSLKDVQVWDFKNNKFVSVDSKEVYSGNIESVETKEKAKFPQNFFPECKWSRKGFLRTRWFINGTLFDLINIHLFHDASNFVAMEEFPSIYSKNRKRALDYTLNRFQEDNFETAPFFVFGDFNFRTDTDGVVKKLTEGLTTTRIQNSKNADHTKLQYRDDSSRIILTVGKKEFTHTDHQDVFLNFEDYWLKTFDRELESFKEQLYEYPITFPPSYPFEENVKQATKYMQTRCPSWCDRVLLSSSAKSLVKDNNQVTYGIIGQSTCMGDHKPVYLHLELLSNTGTKNCRDIAKRCDSLPNTCIKSYVLDTSITINITDASNDDLFINNCLDNAHNLSIDLNLLHDPLTKEMLLHEPYTPESDSSSPMISEDVDKNIYTFPKPVEFTSTQLETSDSVNTPISPQLLKSRLENILRTENKNVDCSDNIISDKVKDCKSINRSCVCTYYLNECNIFQKVKCKICNNYYANSSKQYPTQDISNSKNGTFMNKVQYEDKSMYIFKNVKKKFICCNIL